jgi:RNA polymerase sigma-70 factor (ECF subfamily)
MHIVVDRAFALFRERRSHEDLLNLLEACRAPALSVCAGFLGQREDAEDASQQVLLEIAEHAASLDTPECFRTWFFRVCRARSLDLRRRRARRASHESRAEPASPNGHGRPDDDARGLLFAAIADLPESDRDLVIEHYFRKTPLRVLAESRGCSKVAIWKRLERIRAALLRRLKGAGLAALIPYPREWIDRARAEPKGTGVLGRILPWGGASLAGLVFVVAMSSGAGAHRPSMPPPFSASAPPAPVARESFAVQKVVVEPVPESSPEKPAVEPRASEFKALVRRLFRQIQDQRKTGVSMSPELSLELSPINDLAREAHRDPAGNADRYAEFASLLFEIAAEECGLRFSTVEAARASALRKDLASALAAVPSAPPIARLLGAVEADLAFVRGMTELLPRDEPSRLVLSDVDRILKRGRRKSMPETRLSREIVADWSVLASSDGWVEAAAGRLSAALGRLTHDFRARVGEAYDEDDYSKRMLDRAPVTPYDPIRRLEYQAEALRAQIDALDGLHPDQREKLLSSEPWNYAVSRHGVLIEVRE